MLSRTPPSQLSSRGKSRLLVVGFALSLLAVGGVLSPAVAQDPGVFQPMDVFGLEWATDPQVSPGGATVVYVRNFFDVMTDRRRTNLWIVAADGSLHLSLIHISEPTRHICLSRMPSSA